MWTDGWRACRGVRINLAALDAVLAAALTVAAQLGIWVGSDATHHQIAGAAVALCITVPIGLRRRYPFVVGTGVPSVGAIDHALWSPSSIAYPMATFLALYALAVWTPTRRFLAGALLIVAASLGASVASGGSAEGPLPS